MIWAAIDVMNGECVQLKGGDPHTARFNRNPIEAATHWIEQGADGLHVIDLDSALGKGSNAGFVKKILNQSPIPVQVGGGIRSMEDIEHWLELGATRVIVGTKGITDQNWLGEICNHFSQRIVLAIDAKSGRIATNGWTKSSEHNLFDFAKSVDKLDLAGFLYTNIDVEGSESGIEADSVRTLCKNLNTPVLVSGGISSKADIELSLSLGAAGVVVGTALYSGAIDLGKLTEERANETI